MAKAMLMNWLVRDPVELLWSVSLDSAVNGMFEMEVMMD